MDFTTLLLNRRSIRDFLDRDVPLVLVEEIIQDTRLAPSASNRQPCRFIIIRDRNMIERLSGESKRNLMADLARNPGLPLKQYETTLADEKFNVFYNAPCLVYFIGPSDLFSLDVDCALAAAYFMFSAANRGLGTCWVGLGANIRDPTLRNEIGVPEGCRIVAPVILGYPKRVPSAPQRRAPEIVKVV